MSCKFICDGCGKEADGFSNGVSWFKPGQWYEKSYDIGNGKLKTLSVCSRNCIQTASKKYKVHNIVLPV